MKNWEVEEAKARCKAAIERIEKLPSNSKSKSNISESCKQTLRKLALSELNFLSRVNLSASSPLSINIGHLEAVVHILQQPFITGVSRVCKPLPLSLAQKNRKKDGLTCKGVYVDIVCTLNRKPVWIIVSDRNPNYISWDRCHKSKGLKSRIQQVLAAAEASQTLKPTSIFLFFSYGLGNFVFEKLQQEFGASVSSLEFTNFDLDFVEDLENDWISVLARPYREARALEIKLDSSAQSLGKNESGLSPAVRPVIAENDAETNLGDSFCSLISGLQLYSMNVETNEAVNPENLQGEYDLINLDTTALIALVSGISNGTAKRLLASPETDLKLRFKGNFKFVMEQIMSEIEIPIHSELKAIMSGKRGIVCNSVCSEFKELVLMCGGPSEKLRADHLLKHLTIVPDNPSERMMAVPTTRKLALKNKIVFGTGDHWCALTLTANMAFVRAITQTGMSLSTILHRPRALTGD